MHSSSRYLAANSVHQSSALQQSETHTDACVDADGRQTDDVGAASSQATQDRCVTKPEESSTSLSTVDLSRMTFDPECIECQSSFQTIKPDTLEMYLHAYRYQVRFCRLNYVKFTHPI